MSEDIIGPLEKCQICGQSLELILSLGHQALVHGHLTSKQLNEPETTYPLNLCRCSSCGLLQLNHIVDPKVVFHKNYPYQTGMTNMLIENFRSLAATMAEKFKLTKDDLVVDIGSNDGTLLKQFVPYGARVLGVEPTNAASVAEKNGITTVNDFFTEEIAKKIVDDHGKAKVITATNVFAHVNNLFPMLRGIDTMLSEDGVFVSESQYLFDVIKKLEFDTIYHEHLRYYSLKPLISLFSKVNFSIVDAERITAAGGSIRVFAMKGTRPPSDRLVSLIAEEEKAGLYDKKALEKFGQRAIDIKHKLLDLLLECKKGGNRIVGVGAPARSNTLLGFSHIDHNILDYACEKAGSPKIGLYTPGTHIPIVDEQRIFEDQPEYALILSWHIQDELIKKMREGGFKGKIIVPLPEPRIVGN
ncbi:MAG: class I SAM-dependent methyltransferase [Candidatus Aenigmarchaeota archaeon]|nr:class I SAM-dependent methyltransferase [Candidatus Aenigmarchaeota archaeon]